MSGVLNFFKQIVVKEFFNIATAALSTLPDSPIVKYGMYLLKEVAALVDALFSGKNIGDAVSTIWQTEKATIIGNTLETTRATLDTKIHNDSVRKLVDDLLTDLNGVLLTGNILPGTNLQKLYDIQNSTAVMPFAQPAAL